MLRLTSTQAAASSVGRCIFAVTVLLRLVIGLSAIPGLGARRDAHRDPRRTRTRAVAFWRLAGADSSRARCAAHAPRPPADRYARISSARADQPAGTREPGVSGGEPLAAGAFARRVPGGDRVPGAARGRRAIRGDDRTERRRAISGGGAAARRGPLAVWASDRGPAAAECAGSRTLGPAVHHAGRSRGGTARGLVARSRATWPT